MLRHATSVIARKKASFEIASSSVFQTSKQGRHSFRRATTMQVIVKEPTIHKVEQLKLRERMVDFPLQRNYQGLVKCKFCARMHMRRKEERPAYGKNCNRCGR